MLDAVTTEPAPLGVPGTAEPTLADEADIGTPSLEILREIVRGGLAGLLVGVLLGGVGGRIVMRAAALIVPEAAGLPTENGNAIGAITLGGSLALIVFIGLFVGVIAGSLWVVIAPWMPTATGPRVLLSIPIAIALGTLALIDDRNRDFVLLQHDPLVIALLVVLVGLHGPALVAAERWLERRLPHARPRDLGLVGAYAMVAILGTFLTIILVVPLYLFTDMTVAGIGVFVVGLATLASWRRRTRGNGSPAAWLTLVARAGLTAATIAGLVVAVREISGALNLE
jgi:MFS family permease